MDYPTHVVVKSAKVVPMMIMGFFILGVRLFPLYIGLSFQYTNRSCNDH